MTDAGRVSGCLHVQVKVNQIDQYLHVSLGLHVPSHDTKTEPGFAIFRDECGNDCVEWTFVRFECVQVVGIKSKQRASILQDKPGVVSNDAGAKTEVVALYE